MLYSVEVIDQWLQDLNYKEDLFDFDQLEAGLSIVANEKGPPDFYMSLDGGVSHLPLTKLASSKFGTLSGVKPSIYKEFAHNPPLTTDMVHYSMNKSERGGRVYVAHTKDSILNFYPADKAYVGLMDSWHAVRAIGDPQHGSAFVCPKGGFEIALVMDDPTHSVRSGILLRHDGRPKIAVYTTMHDHSALCSSYKVAKKKKSRDGSEGALTELATVRANEAMGEAEYVYKLVNTKIGDPAKFLSRLALMNKFSEQSSNKVVTGVVEALEPEATLYDVVRYVAGFATKSDGTLVERRYQEFAHFVAFRGPCLCSECALPN